MADAVVLALVPDLMFATRIESALGYLGYRAAIVKDAAALLAAAHVQAPALLLVDLAAHGVDVPAAIAALKASPVTRPIPLIAFGPHLDEASRAAAQAAGADAVVANSKLALDLPGLVARYVPASES